MSDDAPNIAPAQRAVAIPTPQGSLLPHWWVRAYGPDTMYVTRLDLSRPDAKRRLLQSINEDCIPVKDVLNLPLEIVAFTVSPAGREQDGELQEWVRCVLHLADGRNIAAGSQGLLKSIMVIEQLDRKAPWEPPIVKVVKAGDLGNGKQWYKLVDPPVDAPARPNRKGA